MSAGFYNTDLAGAVTSAYPSISYAFNQYNSFLFGIDATYTGFDASQFQVTPTILYPDGFQTASCSPFTANVPQQSIDCDYQNYYAGPGLYTLEFNRCTTVFSDDPCTFTTLPGAVTFSIVLSPSATAIPTNTITVTATSGATDTTATTTTLPGTIVTVTTYYVNAVATATTTLTGAQTVTVAGTCPSSTSPTSTSKTAAAVACNHDKCLRALLGKTSSASAFCAAYTAAPTYHGTTPSAFATSCMSSASRLSSACTCLATSPPKTRKVIRGMSGAYEESGPEVHKRGGVAVAYAPPDYTFGPGQYIDGTVYGTTTATATDTATTIPSTTTTDPGALVTSGTTTTTVHDPSTLTVQTATIDSRTTVTVTMPPPSC